MPRLSPVSVAMKTLRRQPLPSRCKITETEAVEILRKATGQDFGNDVEKWGEFLKQNRRAYHGGIGRSPEH